jgi:AcrR family transcriptional regulator
VSPRHSAERAQRTRAEIIDAAALAASVTGLDGLTIGRLAGELRLSKAGVVGPFGSKEALQLAVLERAVEVFREQVWRPVAHLPAGRERLLALCERWFSYLERCPFPGGCLVTTASVEWDARGGALRDAAAIAQARWLAALGADAEVAVRAGELPAETDPDQVAFEIMGIGLSLNQSIQLLADPEAGGHARAALRRLVGDPAP